MSALALSVLAVAGSAWWIAAGVALGGFEAVAAVCEFFARAPVVDLPRVGPSTR